MAVKGNTGKPESIGRYLCKCEAFNMVMRQLYTYHAICFWDGKIWTNGDSSAIDVVKWWDLKDFE